MMKCEAFPFALSRGSSYHTKSLVVTLRRIKFDSCGWLPVRTELSHIKAKRSASKSQLFVSLK